MPDNLTQPERDLLELFGIPPEQLAERKEQHARYRQLTATREGKLLVLIMWLQQGDGNILILRRNDQWHDIHLIDMDGVAYTQAGGVLSLSDAEIDELLFLTQHTFAAQRLPDGRVVDVVPLTYGQARINISSHFSPLLYNNGY